MCLRFADQLLTWLRHTVPEDRGLCEAWLVEYVVASGEVVLRPTSGAPYTFLPTWFDASAATAAAAFAPPPPQRRRVV